MDKVIELAIRLLGGIEGELTISFMKEENAYYISRPIKGGGSVIVANDGSFLFADSSVGFIKHLEEFKKGRRSNG